MSVFCSTPSKIRLEKERGFLGRLGLQSWLCFFGTKADKLHNQIFLLLFDGESPSRSTKIIMDEFSGFREKLGLDKHFP